MNSFCNTEMPGIDGIKNSAFLWEIIIFKHEVLLIEFLMSVIFSIFNFYL